MRRVVLGLVAVIVGSSALAQIADPAAIPGYALRPKMILIPLDDRPATTQFAEMIGEIAGADVELPPRDLLGRFTVPGRPEGIIDWLKSKDLSRYQSVILSTDMIAYGGLIASRLPDTDYSLAIQRLREVQRIRRANPRTKFYGFSSIMRLAPTALRHNVQWRDKLRDLAAVRARIAGDPATEPKIKQYAANLAKLIPDDEIKGYYSARDRNRKVQQELLRMTGVGVWEYLILGQDDAQPIGPHVAETKRLTAMAKNLKVTTRTYFCEGIDQHANVLMSRALLQTSGWSPRVRIVYADDLGRSVVSPYEANQVEHSLLDQLLASGARLATKTGQYDYSLFINTPKPRPAQFARFVSDLSREVDQGMPVAVADINLGASGTGDPALFDVLLQSGRSTKLLAYAGWNTAGNTIGTAIPAANVYQLSRRTPVDPLTRELNQRAFLLHRLVNDFEYHRFTRPLAYALQAKVPTESKEEMYGTTFDLVNTFVRQDLGRRLGETFQAQFAGKKFFAGTRQFVFQRLDNIDVELPWPRAYEVRLGFKIVANEVPALGDGLATPTPLLPRP